MLNYLLMFLLFVTAFFLIILILIQRGKGGGLAGAFGGLGGQSAFGTKAGDLFTRITIVVAVVWILLCVVSVKFLGTTQTRFGKFGSKAPVRADENPGQSGSDKASEGTSGSEDGGGPSGDQQPSGSGDHE
jgi:preprotein translocase subunit SecG